MISAESSGSYNTDRSLVQMQKQDVLNLLNEYGYRGVNALSSATPIDTGETAANWYFEVKRQNGSWTIIWENSHMTENGVPVAILIQYGHGTGTGGYVEGRDFINPAIQPLFDQMAEELWRGVTNA